MLSSGAGGLLAVVTPAVTPVVLISAAAILITGVTQKHSALADRLRMLAQEYRADGTSDKRREAIRAQTALFLRRVRYVSAAHVMLYGAVVCFVGMVLVMALAPRTAAWDFLALGEFVTGILLVLASMAAELAELLLAGLTIRLEIEDILKPPDG